MLNMNKKDDQWRLMINRNGESYPIVIHARENYVKYKLMKIQQQINSHSNPERVKNYYFEKAKKFWTEKGVK